MQAGALCWDSSTSTLCKNLPGISSIVSLYEAYCDNFLRLGSLLGRSSRLDFARYFDDCCERLVDDKELPTDSLLVHLVKARKVALKVDDIFAEKNDTQDGKPFEGLHAMIIANVQKELESFVDSIPTHLRSNRMPSLCR